MSEMMTEKEVDNVFSFPYFNFIKKLQLVTGLWPYQSLGWKIIVIIFVYTLLLSYAIPIYNMCRLYCGVDLALCSESIAAILYAAAVIFKHMTMSLSEKKFKNIYERLARNWLAITDPEEHAIMVKYANIGKVYSTAYITFMAVAAISFVQLPAIPVILDVLFPLNQSRPKILYIKAEFMVDPHENYGAYFIYFLAGAVSTILIFISVDTTFCTIIHQIVGLTAVIKNRLHNATKAEELRRGNSYDAIIKAITVHQESISFVELIKSSFSEFFLFIVLGTAVFLSFGAMVILHSKTLFDIIRFILISIAVIMHIFYFSLNAQKIIDCSDDLYTSIFATEWYNIPARSKKLLRFMMLRTSKPLSLTAGGFYVMSIYNFGLIMKTTVSYVTVLLSFR